VEPAGGAVKPAVLAAGGVPPSIIATTQTQLTLQQNIEACSHLLYTILCKQMMIIMPEKHGITK